jgi:hypothetical protein
MLEAELPLDTALEYLRHENGFVRYWTVIAVQERGIINDAIKQELNKLTKDEFPTVQIEAAKTLINLANETQNIDVITQYIENIDSPLMLYASRAFQEVYGKLKESPEPVLKVFEALDIAMQDRRNHYEYYKLYSYWALSAVLD